MSVNTAVGYQALPTGRHNVAVGWNAGTRLTTGHHNTLIGTDAGRGIVTGHHNICIGDGAGADLPPDSRYAVVIGNVAVQPSRSWWRRGRRQMRRQEDLRHWVNGLITSTLFARKAR